MKCRNCGHTIKKVWPPNAKIQFLCQSKVCKRARKLWLQRQRRASLRSARIKLNGRSGLRSGKIGRSSGVITTRKRLPKARKLLKSPAV